MRQIVGRRVRAWLWATLAAAALSGGALVAAGGPAGATTSVTLYVNATSGTKTTGCTATGATACATLQEGVTAAENLTGDAVTVVVAPGTYAGGVAIDAAGLASLAVEASGSAAVTGGGTKQGFSVASGNVVIAGLEILRGHASDGGAVSVSAPATVTLSSDVFDTDSASSSGGAVYNAGTVTLTRDEFSHDSANTGGAVQNNGGATAVIVRDVFSTDTANYGGAITNYGNGNRVATSTIKDDSFSADIASTSGGAVDNYATTTSGAFVTMTNDTFAGDVAPNYTGGALFNFAAGGGTATATMTNDTFVGDSAKTTGGAVESYATKGGTVASTMTFDTFSRDTAPTGGGALQVEAIPSGTSTASVTASVFGASSCATTNASLAGSFDVTSTTSGGCPASRRVALSRLGLATTLALNTTPTGPQTLALSPTSAAIDVVPAAECTVTVGHTTITTDERGFPRPGNPTQHNCDAGAYEYQGIAPGTTGPTTGSAALTVRRVYGPTPDATAAAELSSAFAGTCPGTTGSRPVVLATDETYADALSSAYLATDLSTGTLLTPTAGLSPVTRAAIQKEGITHVYVVGGSLAVSTAVVSALESTPASTCGGASSRGADLVVTRIAGSTAATTAAKVATFVGKAFVGAADLSASYGGPGKFNTTTGASSPAAAPGPLPSAIVASSAEFQDAEGGAVLSYAQHLPILLTTPTSLPAPTAAALGALGIRQVVLLGGPLAISTAVVASLEAEGISVLRVAGRDYTGTSVALAGLETAPPGAHEGFGWDAHDPGLAVARGNGFQDGLAGAALAAHGFHGSGPVPVLLTENPTTIGTDLQTYLRAVGAHGIGSPPKAVDSLLVLGGPSALSPAVVTAMAREA